MSKAIEPHLFVVFGATGDLMNRKLLPALFKLMETGPLAGCSTILGVARGDNYNDEKFRRMAHDTLVEAGVMNDETAHKWCEKNLYYQPIDHGDSKDYQNLRERIESIERELDLPGNRAFYMAPPASASC